MHVSLDYISDLNNNIVLKYTNQDFQAVALTNIRFMRQKQPCSLKSQRCCFLLNLTCNHSFLRKSVIYTET